MLKGEACERYAAVKTESIEPVNGRREVGERRRKIKRERDIDAS